MPQHKALILCIDDDGPSLESRGLLLESSGYKVLSAASAIEGLELFARHAIDAVLVDYQMPVMNGDVVAARMKSIKPRIPIVMLSAHRSLPQDKLVSVDAFLSKGEPWSGVLARLDELLRLDLPFFSRWLGDWRQRRTSRAENPLPTHPPAAKAAKRSL